MPRMLLCAMQEVPIAVMFVVSCLIVVEHTSDGNEGLVYGLATSLTSLGKGLPNAIGNEVFGSMRPSLSDASNYIPSQGGDQKCFRDVVYVSFCMCYAARLCSLPIVMLLPSQKDHARWRMRTWPSHDMYAWSTLLLVTILATYTIIINLLPLTSLACLRVAGGQGCTDTTVRTSSFAKNATIC